MGTQGVRVNLKVPSWLGQHHRQDKTLGPVGLSLPFMGKICCKYTSRSSVMSVLALNA